MLSLLCQSVHFALFFFSLVILYLYFTFRYWENKRYVRCVKVQNCFIFNSIDMSLFIAHFTMEMMEVLLYIGIFQLIQHRIASILLIFVAIFVSWITYLYLQMRDVVKIYERRQIIHRNVPMFWSFKKNNIFWVNRWRKILSLNRYWKSSNEKDNKKHLDKNNKWLYLLHYIIDLSTW